jgi:hypothetical protein
MVRLHEVPDGPGGPFQDLTIEPDGKLTLWVAPGEGASARGLLAGERLETLARLIDALPPNSYSPSEPCATDRFFVSVTRGAEVRTYASGACDAAAPEALAELRRELSNVAGAVGRPRRAVLHRVLAQGDRSGIASERIAVVRSEAELVRLLSEHRRDGAPIAIPRVDFSREMVVARFLGDSPRGTSLGFAAAERTDDGDRWLRLGFSLAEPGVGCDADGTTRPFVLVAVEREDEEILFETERSVFTCHGS